MRNHRLRLVTWMSSNSNLGLGWASHMTQPTSSELKNRGQSTDRAVGQPVSMFLFLCVNDWHILKFAQGEQT